VHFSSDPEVRHRIAFVEDYDMEVARVLCEGADMWLNNPRRPLEACGTSGMKAALNGAVNCSVLDGWWDEAYNGTNGWTIGSAHISEDYEYQDRVDASSLYELLEREIAPRFYDHSDGPAPRRWTERIKASITSLGPLVTADRMVEDYAEVLYEPAAGQARDLSANGFERARALAAWKAKVRAAWTDVKVIEVEGDGQAAEVGNERTVTAKVQLGRLDPNDVKVQLAHGQVGPNDELEEPAFVDMQPAGTDGEIHTYIGAFAARASGLYGFAVRVVPAHPDLCCEMDMGLVAWA